MRSVCISELHVAVTVSAVTVNNYCGLHKNVFYWIYCAGY